MKPKNPVKNQSTIGNGDGNSMVMPRTMLPMMMLRMRRITYSKVGWLSRLGQASQVETPEAPRKNGTCQLWQLESFRNDTEKKMYEFTQSWNHGSTLIVYGLRMFAKSRSRQQVGTVWYSMVYIMIHGVHRSGKSSDSAWHNNCLHLRIESWVFIIPCQFWWSKSPNF